MKRKIADNLKRVQQRIREACERVGRDESEVTMVAVTKYATLDVVRALVNIGVAELGESRVQEFTKRAAALNEWLRRRSPDSPPPVRPRWHMIGHLQRNKVKALLPWVDMIHSVDSLRLAEELDLHLAKLGRKIPILLQVNLTDNPAQHGVAVAATTHLAEQVCSLEHLELRGLMAIGPDTEDGEATKYTFGRARELFDEIVTQRTCGPNFCDLSLGMSQDFEYGIEAGATYVRVGSALLKGIELAPEPVSVE